MHYYRRMLCDITGITIGVCNVTSPGVDPGIYLGGPNQGPRSKVKGEARVEGAKRPRIEGKARTDGEAREKAGGGVWGGGSVSPSP